PRRAGRAAFTPSLTGGGRWSRGHREGRAAQAGVGHGGCRPAALRRLRRRAPPSRGRAGRAAARVHHLLLLLAGGAGHGGGRAHEPRRARRGPRAARRPPRGPARHRRAGGADPRPPDRPRVARARPRGGAAAVRAPGGRRAPALPRTADAQDARGVRGAARRDPRAVRAHPRPGRAARPRLARGRRAVQRAHRGRPPPPRRGPRGGAAQRGGGRRRVRVGAVSCPNVIPNVLAARYASAELVRIWQPSHTIVLERRLWLAVLRAQRDLGVDVPDGVLEDYERVVERVDLDSIAGRERVTRHDVKARIEEFNALAGHEHVNKGL